jgi:predicted RNA-binding Zn-ribbon protein involved in translation (DUF1610 family)
MSRVEFICPECRNTVMRPATLADENATCPACGAEVISRTEHRRTPSIPASAAGTPEAKWHYSVDDEVHGPVTESQLRAMIEDGTIRRSDLVWREGMPDWAELGTLPGFFLKMKKPKPLEEVVERKSRSSNDDDNDNDDEADEEVYRETRRRGRKKRPRSPDYTVPIVIAGVVIFLAIGAVAFVGLCAWAASEAAKKRAIDGTDSDYGKRLEFKGGELYYTRDVTLAEANRLGNYLVKELFFNNSFVSVQLARSGGTYQVRYPVKIGADKQPDYIESAKQFAKEISENVFFGAPTEIHFCNEHFGTLRVVVP